MQSQSAADFISDFIRGPLKKLDSEEELRSAITGVIGLNRESLHEGVVRKLIAALRKKKCKVNTPRNNDPFEVLVKWIAAAPTDAGHGSGAVNNSLQEHTRDPSPPKRGKRTSSRRKRGRTSDSEEEPPLVNNGGVPPSSSSANHGDAPLNGDAPPPPPPPPNIAGQVGGQGAINGNVDQAPPPPSPPNVDPNKKPEGSAADSENSGKAVVFDQNTYVSLVGLIGRFNAQLDELSAEQKRTKELLEKQQSADNSKPSPKRQRKPPSPKTGSRSQSPKSPEQQLPASTRADLSELDKFISDPIDDGGFDAESKDLADALKDFGKQVRSEDDDDDVLIVSEHGDSNDESDEPTNRRQRRNQESHLKFSGLRPKSERTRAITHQNGFPEAIKWLRSKGISLARFVAGHETHMKPRDKQELEVLSTALLSLVDQVQPGMVIQLDVADILIRRIMGLCLRDKLDEDYLEVLSNPSGSHLAPLEWLTEANKVYKIVKKARDSRPTPSSSQPPTPRWRSQQQHAKSGGSKNHGTNSHVRSGARNNRVPAPRSPHQPKRSHREKHNGGKGAGTDASSSSNNN